VTNLETILVIGASGNIGASVVGILARNDVKVHAAISQKKEINPWAGNDNVKPVIFNFLDQSTYAKAMEGVKKVFFVRPPQLSHPKEEIFPFLTYLTTKAIEHVVFVSLLGVEKNPFTPHHKIEKEIERLQLPYTFLRPSFFMQNLNTTHREDIQKNGDLFIPAGKAKTSFIDTRDIGEVAANCLLNTFKHLQQKYDLTGKEALTYYQIAEIMTTVLGKKITYSKPSLWHFRSVMVRRGKPKEYVNVMVMLYFITKLGNANKVTPVTQQLLKREPTSFKQYVKDYRLAFL
jgi:uncharacterized protein YbjT (DUF2867 family)